MVPKYSARHKEGEWRKRLADCRMIVRSGRQSTRWQASELLLLHGIASAAPDAAGAAWICGTNKSTCMVHSG